MALSRNVLFGLISFFGILIIFTGCASNVPITTSIIDEVGPQNTVNFQYYLSKAVTLNLVAQENTTTIEDGKLVKKNVTARRQIIISEYLPGLVRSYASNFKDSSGNPVEGYVLKLAFENYEGDPLLFFAQNGNIPDGKYYIYYNASKDDRTILYGNDPYIVSYQGEEPPYLLIKMKESSSETSSSRNASGLRLGE